MTLAPVERYQRALSGSERRLGLVLRRNYARLDLRDLDAKWPTYAEAAGYAVAVEHAVTTRDALLYFLDVLIEAGATPRSQPVPRPFNSGLVTSLLRLCGPIHVRRLIENGWEEQAAMLSGLRRTVRWVTGHLYEEAQQNVLDAGEFANTEAEIYGDSMVLQGHQRRAEPGACGFCRLLAGAAKKAPVYDVTERWKRPHPGCKCTVIPVPVYRTVYERSAREIALGQQMHARIKDSRDRALIQARQQAA